MELSVFCHMKWELPTVFPFFLSMPCHNGGKSWKQGVKIWCCINWSIKRFISLSAVVENIANLWIVSSELGSETETFNFSLYFVLQLAFIKVVKMVRHFCKTIIFYWIQITTSWCFKLYSLSVAYQVEGHWTCIF